MRSRLKPVVILILIAPFLTELLSNNLPPSVFFHPVVFLFLATIGYGFPLLLLRELACRKRMGIAGMICLGLVYGIINEGILAKTFYMAVGVPINTFTGYGRVLGVNVPWAILISVWHAFHALLYPIFITYYFFTDHRDEPWLSRKAAIGLAIPTGLMLTLAFFGHSKGKGPGLASHYVLMLLCMGLLVWIATRIARPAALTGETVFRLKPVCCGVAAFFGLFFIPIIFAGAKVPVAVFYGYTFVVFAVLFRWLFKQPTLPVMTCLLFALGDDTLFTVFAFIPSIRQASVEKLTANTAFLVIFGFLIARLRKDSHVLNASSNRP